MSFSETLVTCPYDQLHKIRPERLATHLVKCRKQHPHVELDICPYNWTHHISPGKMESHMKNCRDRDVVAKQAIETKWTPGKAWPAAEPIPSSEDWDAEMEGVVPYDPRVAAASRLVICRPQTLMTKTEKQGFRQKERDRWDRLTQGQEVKGLIAETTNDFSPQMSPGQRGMATKPAVPTATRLSRPRLQPPLPPPHRFMPRFASQPLIRPLGILPPRNCAPGRRNPLQGRW